MDLIQFKKIRFIFVLSVVCSIFIFILYLFSFLRLGFGWDLDVYLRAIELKEQGYTGYERIGALNFVYHPFVLEFFSSINRLIQFSYPYFIYCLYTLYSFINQVSVPTVRIDKKHKLNVLTFVFLGLFCLSGVSYLGLVSLNIALFLNLHIVTLILRLQSKNKKFNQLCLISLICAAGFVKPYFFIYFLYFFVKSLKLRIAYLAPFIFLSLLSFLVATLTISTPFRMFMKNLSTATIGDYDLGFSVFSMLFARLGLIPSLIIHFIIGATLFLMFLRAYLQSKNTPMSLALLAIPIIALNPRLKEYDLTAAFLILLFYLAANFSNIELERLVIFLAFFGLTYLFSTLYLPPSWSIGARVLPLSLIYYGGYKLLSMRE